ncbi:UNVERIFIED_CONTAM: hemin receptor [Mumia flava]
MAILAGCATPGPQAEASGTITDIPALAEATPADDAKAYEGELQLDLGDAIPEPVTEDPVQDLPTTVTDAQGTKVEVDAARRVLALDQYGTLSQTVYELGLGDLLVGRDVSTTFEQAVDLPLVTQNGHELNGEAILDLEPDLILTDTSLGPWDVIEQMRDSGVAVVVVESGRSLDNVSELIGQVAGALGVPDAGDALAKRTQAAIDDVEAQVEATTPAAVQEQLRTVFLYVRGQSGVYYMFGEGSGADALIDAAGGYDVAREIGWDGMKPLNDEGLLAAQPDAILMMSKGLDSAGGVDGLLDRYPALAQTPAGQHRRFITLPDSQILSFGPRSADVINALAVALYAPEALS